ncbi:MAG TPA: nitrate/sulfonate/bicarbonate ABC transporter ATP-binding protein [Candidatus Kapabacteria bacterium]|nr:nitrate/sulfonate/bicarbonate ABC transporter ATP-binding protein [Candidatus Kapabacteria bacterium]
MTALTRASFTASAAWDTVSTKTNDRATSRQVTQPMTSPTSRETMIPQGSVPPQVNTRENVPIVEVRDITKSFTLPSGKELTILEKITLDIREGEILAVLGPSGCGKSTIMRIITGLLLPTSGTVRIYGEPLTGINKSTAIVFQNFALYPWLSVYDNIAIGLQSLNVPPAEIKERVTKAIDTVGLEGFEEAYPKELSGGMKQRVGFARAIVVDPALLCLDEPFSALDVLTAENLTQEVLNLWVDHKTNVKSMFFVTHNIEEAVFLANRIIVLGANPGHIRYTVSNDLPYPRTPRSPEFEKLVEHIHSIITNAILPDETPSEISVAARAPRIEALPYVQIGEVIGLLELLHDEGGSADVFDIAEKTGKEFGITLAVVKAAELLDFVDTPKQQVVFTELGKKFIASDVNDRKKIVNQQLRAMRIFLILTGMLQNSPEYTLEEDVLLEELALLLPNENPEQLLNTAIQWGRFAELIGYNADTHNVYLDIGQESNS